MNKPGSLSLSLNIVCYNSNRLGCSPLDSVLNVSIGKGRRADLCGLMSAQWKGRIISPSLLAVLYWDTVDLFFFFCCVGKLLAHVQRAKVANAAVTNFSGRGSEDTQVLWLLLVPCTTCLYYSLLYVICLLRVIPTVSFRVTALELLNTCLLVSEIHLLCSCFYFFIF